jgi:bifunctional oligoribonuclease and PAP phosphatase NrnA
MSKLSFFCNVYPNIIIVILSNFQYFEELKALLAKPSKIVITTHYNPDGDALGSVLALYRFLKKAGHEVSPISPNDYPEFLRWLPGNEEVIDYTKRKSYAEQLISNAEIIFYLDHNDAKRGSDMAEALAASGAKRIMIDHHPSPQLPVDYQISVTEASSTCELIYEFMLGIGGQQYIDKSIAECIYTGIMTDTGCFSYNSSRTRTFEIVSQLLDYSIEKDDIYGRIYDNYSAQRMRLLGYCLNDKMQVLPEFNTAYIALTAEEQKKYDFIAGDTEGFVNYPLSIKGVCFTAFFTESKEKIKISFRSRGKFAANLFSEKNFNGGGHTNAAGGESKLSLLETIKKFEELLPLYAKELHQ